MSTSISDLIVELQPFAEALVNLGAQAGVYPRITSTLRARAQQQRLYRAFLRGETHYPVAPPGTSAHEFGYAFDMIADTTENLHDLGSVWTQWGGIWSPSDEVHFEYPGFVKPSVPVEVPAVSVSGELTENTPQGIVARAAQAYANLPWYYTLLVPTSATVSTGTITDVSKGSIGSRALCYLGASSFC